MLHMEPRFLMQFTLLLSSLHFKFTARNVVSVRFDTGFFPLSLLFT
jgi:hypothetical protein